MYGLYTNFKFAIQFKLKWSELNQNVSRKIDVTVFEAISFLDSNCLQQ